jgi:hypothetical protein
MAYLNSIPPHASGGHGTREPAECADLRTPDRAITSQTGVGCT